MRHPLCSQRLAYDPHIGKFPLNKCKVMTVPPSPAKKAGPVALHVSAGVTVARICAVYPSQPLSLHRLLEQGIAEGSDGGNIRDVCGAGLLVQTSFATVHI